MPLTLDASDVGLPLDRQRYRIVQVEHVLLAAEPHDPLEPAFRFRIALDLHAQITCLAVDATSAWIGGVVTHTSDENSFPLGGEFWFRIQDNGEGSGDPPDRMSFIRLGAPASICSQQRPVGMPFNWLHGNVRVR